MSFPRFRFRSDEQRLAWVSKQFHTETQLQNAIELILAACGACFVREAENFYGRSRADFWIRGKGEAESVHVEAKIDTRSTAMDRALGQALRGAVCDNCKTWFVIPDDVRINQVHIHAAEAIGSEIVRISDLIGRIEAFNKEGKTGYRYLDQKAAFKHGVINAEPLNPRKVKKAVEKRSLQLISARLRRRK
jgi:hypothetical protein